MITAYGVKGMKSTAWTKTFVSEAALEAWLEKQNGNVQVLGYSA